MYAQKCIRIVVLDEHYAELLHQLNMKYISPYLFEKKEISACLESKIRSSQDTERINLVSEFLLNIAPKCQFHNILYSLHKGGYDFLAKMLRETYDSKLHLKIARPTRCLDLSMDDDTFKADPYYQLKRLYDNGDAVTKTKIYSLLDNFENRIDRIFNKRLFRSLSRSYNGEFAGQNEFYNELKQIVRFTSNPYRANLLLLRHRSFTMLHLRRKSDSCEAMEMAQSEIANFSTSRETVEIQCGICLNRLECSTPFMSSVDQNGLYAILKGIEKGYLTVADDMEKSELHIQKNIVDIVRCLVAMKITVHGEEISHRGISREDIRKSKDCFMECEKNGTLQSLTKKWQIVVSLARAKIARLETNTLEAEFFLQSAIEMAKEIPFLPFLQENVDNFIRVYLEGSWCPLPEIFTEEMEL